jgi:uncharacterized protein (UPF0332 family)
MSSSINDFIDQSLRLLAGNHEIDYRSAISRSYYGAYHSAESTADRLELALSSKNYVGAHEKLIDRFEAQGKALKKIAKRIRSRKLMRSMADYQLDESVLRDEAALEIKEAKQLIIDLNALIHKPKTP